MSQAELCIWCYVMVATRSDDRPAALPVIDTSPSALHAINHVVRTTIPTDTRSMLLPFSRNI